MKSMGHGVHAVGGILLSVAGVAAGAELETLVKTCASLRNDAERLVCYDRVVAQLYSGDSGDAQAPADGLGSAEAMFGMGREVSAGRPSQIPDREEISSISAQVRSLQEAADGSLLIELDSGQIWRQVDSRKLVLKIGDSVTISRAALNSFRIATPNNRFGRVKRVQ